eukprot:CAMPEP_0172159268 /NCGR_PEP_ID=MMETSP1050-20130122/4865_1 /TAXON_ID=233186 /ORGANISM="Cryptomonas curvata, Strain CCAP979/52" /LENGTH=265 /DNA_ID=CAMNT_0012828815 /DNA_START=137 /DNA_END=933 /DNA_ORIENTATION=-
MEACMNEDVLPRSETPISEQSISEDVEYEDNLKNMSNSANCSQQLSDEVQQGQSKTGWFSKHILSLAKGVGGYISHICIKQTAISGACIISIGGAVGCGVVLLHGSSDAGDRTNLAAPSAAARPGVHRRPQIPMTYIANYTNYVKIALVAVAATLAATAAAVAATTAMMVTAAAVYWRAAWDYGVGRERRRWYANLGAFALELAELGALLLQMILMTQWVFGEFSVMPVMTTMGMLFTLFHNVHCYVGAHNLADAGELFWWEGAF